MTEVDVRCRLATTAAGLLAASATAVGPAAASAAAGGNSAAGVVGRLGCCTLALLAAAVEWVLI